MHKFFLLIIVFTSNSLFACVCEPLAPISKELLKNYDIVFWGKVDSVSQNKAGENIAYFTVNELYKGNSEQTTQLLFDNASSCMMNFVKSDEWLIYASYTNFDKLNVHLCSHSRKMFAEQSKDVYFTNANRTFEEEKDFLKTELGIQKLIIRSELIKQQSELKPHNDQPSNTNKIILLLISVLVMVGVYIITQKKKK
jgi:hypothetical protein